MAWEDPWWKESIELGMEDLAWTSPAEFDELLGFLLDNGTALQLAPLLNARFARRPGLTADQAVRLLDGMLHELIPRGELDDAIARVARPPRPCGRSAGVHRFEREGGRSDPGR
jgi:hypothetical protein